MRTYWVYILASQSRTPYIGVTNNIHARLLTHREGTGSFTSRYRIDRLVYVESTNDIRAAIAREKQLKGWTRARKIVLITSMNPAWDDLCPPDLSPELWAKDLHLDAERQVQILRCAQDDISPLRSG